MTETAADGADLRLERSSPEPLYRQIAAHIEGEIRRGGLPPGARIDSEASLSARLGVSRVTVRNAIEDLVQRDIVVRKQGKGTFVTLPAVRHDLRNPHGLVASLFSQAADAGMRLARYELKSPPAEIGRAMGLPAGAPALALDRLYLIGSRPAAFAQGWLTPAVASVSRANASLISTEDMMRRTGVRVTRSTISFRAEAAGAAAARALSLTARAPVLVMRRRAFGQDGALKEAAVITFCPDSFEFHSSTSDLGSAKTLFNIRNVASASTEGRES